MTCSGSEEIAVVISGKKREICRISQSIIKTTYKSSRPSKIAGAFIMQENKKNGCPSVFFSVS
jgi:hypothetical protein